MKSDTRQLLSELREDHRNMALVLNVLESTIETASTGEDPDFELIDEIMRYMTVYPDAVHHPKEDIIYAELNRLSRTESPRLLVMAIFLMAVLLLLFLLVYLGTGRLNPPRHRNRCLLHNRRR